MRILVCGGRAFANVWKLTCALNELALSASVIIHGCAGRRIGEFKWIGADMMADQWARDNGIRVERFPANWKSLGNAAGPIRNRVMIKEGRPDFVIAFSGGGGTADMVNAARAAGIIVVEV